MKPSPHFRADAAFAKPELYGLLEAEDIGHAIRPPANPVLQARIGHLLQPFALAYRLANFLRTLAPAEMVQWSVPTLRERLVKIGARIMRHGRCVAFQLAEVAVPRALCTAIPHWIDRLCGPPVPAT